MQHAGPGDVGRTTKIKIKGNEADVNLENNICEDPKSIWLLTEVQEIPASDDTLWDPRDKPKYDIIYKQALKTEDVFLQVSIFHNILNWNKT